MGENRVFLESRELLLQITAFRRAFLLIPLRLLQQDALTSEAEASPYFAHSVPGSLSDFVVAASEDEDPPGSGGSTSEDGGPPAKTSSKQCYSLTRVLLVYIAGQHTVLGTYNGDLETMALVA